MSDAITRQRRAELGESIRTLLAQPFLDARSDRDAYARIVGSAKELRAWFDQTFGWELHVDARGGWARLHKRSSRGDATRPAKRSRGARQPFDTRRYQLLCTICAELCDHPVTTIGLLAQFVEAATTHDPRLDSFDSALHRERAAFVDAIVLLRAWGAVDIRSGVVEDYIASSASNAIVEAGTSRLHALIASAVSPSAPAVAGCDGVSDVLDALREEPRYGTGAGDTAAQRDDEQRNRRLRHRLARRLLDDPVLHLDELEQDELEYLANPSGRRWLLDRAGEAGFFVEERLEGVVAIDPERIATDEHFPASSDNVKQAALLLVDRLVEASLDGRRIHPAVPARELALWAQKQLERHPNWARHYRGDGGAATLAAAAVSQLERFGLVQRDEFGNVTARPALARYRPDDPVIDDQQRLDMGTTQQPASEARKHDE